MRIYNQNVMPPPVDEPSDAAPPLRNALAAAVPGNTDSRSSPTTSGLCPLDRVVPSARWNARNPTGNGCSNDTRMTRSMWLLEGPELLELGEISTHVVGYAVTRGEQILELMTVPTGRGLAAELLARCCGDAIEHDRHCVLLHAPPTCPLFEIFEEAGARCSPPQPTEHCPVHMMRLLDPPKLLRQMIGEFDRRAAESRLPRVFDLGLLVDGQKYQLEFGQDGIGVTSSRVGRSYLRLNVSDFTRLVLGQLDWDAAMADGRLECSSALAREAGRALFPTISLWRPPWDELPALDGWDAAK